MNTAKRLTWEALARAFTMTAAGLWGILWLVSLARDDLPGALGGPEPMPLAA